MSSMVHLTNASLKIKKNAILEDVTLQLEPGRIYGLMGKEGAGKTSLLSLIASYRKPTGGIVQIDGQDPYEDEALMAKVRFVHEVDYTETYRTPKYLCRVAARYRPAFDSSYAFEMLERLGIDSDKALNRMSKGQQDAVNAILGLATNAPITIFDEVADVMDAPLRKQFYKIAAEANTHHPRTMIFSSQTSSEMEHLFDEVIILDEGRVILQEPVDRFLQRGFRVSGKKEKVVRFTNAMNVFSTQASGPIDSVVVLGSLNEVDRKAAREQHLYIEPLKVQELFTILTDQGGVKWIR